MNKERKVKIRKKLYFIIIVMLIIIALLIPFVFASVHFAEPIIETKQFFSVDSLTKVPGSTLEMSLNLDCIQYEDFIFNLSLVNDSKSSCMDISDVTNNINKQNDNENNKEEVNVEYDKNEGSIVISGNKTKMNMSEIKLYYNIPEDAKIGTTITFKAEIEQNQEKVQDENDVVNESSNEIASENNKVEDTSSSNEKASNNQTSNEKPSQEEVNQNETIEVTITIVENTNTENDNKGEEGGFGDNNNSNTNNGQNGQGSNKEQGKNNQFTSMQTSSSSIKQGSNAQKETVTYKGSNNNYLQTLQLEGYTLNKEFSKENTTYFVKIEENVDSIEATAKAEDDDATVCIYGNENIKEGSKILISVTAENGNVRVYRIFVTK